MGIYRGPNIITDGLVLHLDAGSKRCTNTPTYEYESQLGMSEYYCFETGTSLYSAPYSGTQIFRKQSDGTITTVVSKTTEPQRGAFSIAAGSTYYGSKPIYLIDEGDQQRLVPTQFKGRYFFHRTNRYATDTYNFYNPSDSSVTVNMYTGSTGINEPVYQTTTISSLESGSFTEDTEGIYIYFSSSNDIVGTVTATGGDKQYLSPMDNLVYARRTTFRSSIDGTAPDSYSTYYASGSIPVAAIEYADGNGGDMAQHVALKYLSTHYSWGNRLSDFHITAPYPNTEVSTYVYLNSTWVLATTHSLNGSFTSPAISRRDGTNGIDTEGSAENDSGGDPNLTVNGQTPELWKWESNKPIGMWFNDTSNDEESLLGYTPNQKDLINKTPLFLNNAVTKSTEGNGSYLFDRRESTISFEYDETQIEDHDHTILTWVKCTETLTTSFSDRVTVYKDAADSDAWNPGLWFHQSTIRAHTNGKNVSSTWTQDNEWHLIGQIYNHSTGDLNVVLDGEILSIASSNSTYTPTAASGTMFVGNPQNSSVSYFPGYIAKVLMYNRTLTAQELLQMYNSQKQRFGL